MKMVKQPTDNLFDHCVFAIVTSQDLSRLCAQELKGILEDNSGHVKVIGPDNIQDFDDLTHIISATADFPKYTAAQDHLVPVIKPAWITQSLIKGKQASMRPFTPDTRLFYSNVNITCADIPSGDKDAIIGAVLAMGGMESSSLTKMTTHICALTIDHPKCQQAIEKGLKVKIVLPHWFDDCLKLGTRIDEKPYQLPNPEILSKTADDDMPIPSTNHIRGATSPHPENINAPTESPTRERLDVFEKKNVMISDDLGLGSRTRQIIEDLITRGGGFITTSVHRADMYICRWREGRNYVIASRSGIDVGNLSWLYHLITHNQWTSPMRRLLHYPLPPGGIPGFIDTRITLSNYGGEARIYLENLVIAAGGEFTKSMKQDNTHLITARKSSEKCSAAEEWNINMVNHLWIEESYAKCQVQRLTDPRYTHFPPRTNLGEVIGQTQLDRTVLRSLYFSKDPTPSPNDPKPVKRPVMHEKDRNMPSSTRSGEDVEMIGQDEDGIQEGEQVAVKAKKTAPRSKSRVSAQLSTPIVNRRISAGKENDTPSSTGSRSAKEKAINKLHDLAPDMALYEKERKRKSSIWGGERAANQIEKKRSLERSSSPLTKENEEEYSDEDDVEVPVRKRKKANKGPEIEIRLLVTGYKGWLGEAPKELADKRKLRELGILIVQDPKHCTHLAAPAMVRTQKFLCALASGPVIVSSDFIDTCLKEGEVPEEQGFLLKDKDNEKKFKLKLQDIVARAKANKRSLLRRVPIYCTEQIPNGSKTYQAIVESNGGMCNIYRGKGGPTIKPTNPEDDDGPQEPVYLLTGPRPEERSLWLKFTEMAIAGNMIPRIVHAEWLLDVAMSQQLKWNSSYLAGGV